MPKDFPKKYHDVLHTSTSFIHRFYLNILNEFSSFFIFMIYFHIQNCICDDYCTICFQNYENNFLSHTIMVQNLGTIPKTLNCYKSCAENANCKYHKEVFFFFCVINSFANFMRLLSASQGRKENCPFHNFFTTVLGAWKIIKVFVYRNR